MTMSVQFAPPLWHGEPTDFIRLDIYPWMSKCKNRKDIYCMLWSHWGMPDLPKDYDYYLITFPLENINLAWLEQQRCRVGGKFIVVHPGTNYDYKLENTCFITYIEWHNHLDQMTNLHGVQSITSKKKYKFSAICNRVSQGKAWIAAKLLDVASTESLVYINTWIEPKNVHNWELTGNPVLDQLTLLYRQNHTNSAVSDGFTQTDDQRYNSNPWHDIYTNTAMHFVLCSFHYSYTIDGGRSYIYPGPDIDEKILKCLLGGTPFVPCGQFGIYNHLQSVGFDFDYGIDLSYDSDPGNLSRFESITKLIDDLHNMPKDEIVEITKKSTHHNQEYILKKGLHKKCEQINALAVNQILDEME
jgi:hypothetical protein